MTILQRVRVVGTLVFGESEVSGKWLDRAPRFIAQAPRLCRNGMQHELESVVVMNTRVYLILMPLPDHVVAHIPRHAPFLRAFAVAARDKSGNYVPGSNRQPRARFVPCPAQARAPVLHSCKGYIQERREKPAGQ
jgi:hypothetical protein